MFICVHLRPSQNLRGTMDLAEVEQEVRRIAVDLKDVLAVGLFGSLARGDAHERSV